ncbi:hypothetical protein OY671_006090 [Metschnikowia pulcherrima]|nr:hypothetical protein OY671_006090 [Metschnikowia pulcherrima]
MFRLPRITTRIGIRHSSLMADPLQPNRISKSQTMSQFPPPTIVSFDLWNTLFTPKKPIAQQYYEISHGEFQMNKSVQSIESDFSKTFKQMEQEFPNYGKFSSHMKSSNDWWKELIVRVYDISDTKLASRLSERLISHFSGNEAYVLFNDVIPVLEKLKQNSVRIVGASNSDHRVFSVMESLGISQYFPEANVYLSYDLGMTKPNRDFYSTIAKEYYTSDVQQGVCDSMTKFLENAWHVGDHYERDFVGAIKSGWNGVLLDRNRTSIFMRHKQPKQRISNDCFETPCADPLDGDDLVMISNNRICVSSLTEIPRLFGYQ